MHLFIYYKFKCILKMRIYAISQHMNCYFIGRVYAYHKKIVVHPFTLEFNIRT